MIMHAQLIMYFYDYDFCPTHIVEGQWADLFVGFHLIIALFIAGALIIIYD